MTRPARDDWRRQGQERYLAGVRLVEREYPPPSAAWDHDHCEFCGGKFSLLNDASTDFTSGFCTEDLRWICCDCFNAFEGEFGWVVSDGSRVQRG